MKNFIKTLRWNIGVFLLGIAYKIRGEVPQRHYFDKKSMIAGGAAWDNNMDAQYSVYRPERNPQERTKL